MGDRPTALQRLRARPGSVLLPATGVLVVLFLIGATLQVMRLRKLQPPRQA
jgi:hypothetical protein